MWGRIGYVKRPFIAIQFYRILLKPQTNIPTSIHENTNQFGSCVTYHCIVHNGLETDTVINVYTAIIRRIMCRPCLNTQRSLLQSHP